MLVPLVLRAPSAASDFTRAFEHFRASSLPWVAAALAAETASLSCYSLAQRRLLVAGAAPMRFLPLLGLTMAATAVRDLVPGGVVPASRWACVARNCVQVGPARRGAGSTPAACRISHTVEWANA